MLSSTDLKLARRIEAGHAHSGKVFAWETEAIAGGWAIFAGVGTPVTQAIGVGMNGPVTAAELDHLEAFYHSRESAAILDLCTLADSSVHVLVQERGYAIREITNVMARRLDCLDDFASAIEIEETADAKAWGRLVLQGFMDSEELSEEQLAMVTTGNVDKYFALLDGVRSGGAGMLADSGLATLSGDSTLPRARGRGLQLALIRHRVQEAARRGCDLAAVSVIPGSISHRNYERAGFELIYARVMVGLSASPSGAS